MVHVCTCKFTGSNVKQCWESALNPMSKVMSLKPGGLIVQVKHPPSRNSKLTNWIILNASQASGGWHVTLYSECVKSLKNICLFIVKRNLYNYQQFYQCAKYNVCIFHTVIHYLNCHLEQISHVTITLMVLNDKGTQNCNFPHIRVW